jgi:diguanylate cyclase (GGDEF)-like protein
MTISLRRRLLLVVMLPAVLLAAGIASLFAVRGTQAVDDALTDRGAAIVSFLAPAAEYGVITGNRSALASLLQAALEQRDVTAAAVYDASGVALAVSGRLKLSVPASLFGIDHARIVDRGEDRLGFGAPVLAAPVEVDDLDLANAEAGTDARGVGIGSVYVEIDTLSLDNEKRAILRNALLLALLGLGLTAWLAVRMADAVTGPIRSLADAVVGMAGGSLDVAVREDAAIGELRVLQQGFNAMAHAISDAQRTLQARVDEATAMLAHQATHDPLTGLANRRAFEEALEVAVNTSRRAGDHDVLCFIDLDRFKVVNDTCGHAAGDELLRRIAHTIQQRVRSNDLVCRIGGDEFALILRGCGPEEGRRIAEHLREAVAALQFDRDGRRFTVGASIGLVPIGEGVGASEALIAADLACYEAKHRGRNRVVEHPVPADGSPRYPEGEPGGAEVPVDLVPDAGGASAGER